MNKGKGAVEAPAIGRDVWPAARTGGMGERDERDAVQLVALADGLGQRGRSEDRAQREAADRHDQARPQELELPVVPERAQLLFGRGWSAVAASRRWTAGVTARHRCAVERRVERVLVQLEPAAQRLPGAAAPRQALFAFDDAGRLAVQIRVLIRERRAHRERLERIASFGACAAAGQVAL